MKIVTAAVMREIDRRATEEFGIPGILLMENAGLRIAETVRALVPGQRVTVLAGRGNNGGDGLVAARHLRGQTEVTVWLAASPGAYRGDALTNLNILRRLGHPCRVLEGEAALADLEYELAHTGLIVDALLGTGISRDVEEPYATIIRLVNRAGVPVLAVDIPSGVCADTGRVLGDAIRADVTVTFAAAKQGLLLFPGAAHTGRLEVADIGIPPQLLSNLGFEIFTREAARRLLPPRPPDGHKGTFGTVLVVAGSPGMAGAAALCARAALRGGAGLAVAAVPRTVQPQVAAQAAEVVTIPMAENARGNLSAEALYVLREKWRGCGAVAVGPGLSRDSDCLPVLTGILRECQVPVVLDADALNLLALSPSILQARRAPTVLTPHPGEAARLLACSAAEIQADRPKAARRLAERFSSTVVLKGAHTLVAGTDGVLSLNVTGNSGMATAGSGDVLTGLLAALLARGLGTYDAARLAVFLHGLAGDLAAATSGEDGLVAGDILAEIPKAYLELKKINM